MNGKQAKKLRRMLRGKSLLTSTETRPQAFKHQITGEITKFTAYGNTLKYTGFKRDVRALKEFYKRQGKI